MTDLELMQQARDALVYLWDGCPADKALVERLDDRLAQPEPDDGYCQACDGNNCTAKDGCVARDNPPPQREWQGLTDEDRQEIERWIEFKEAGGSEPVPAQKIITYVESKLREKNDG